MSLEKPFRQNPFRGKLANIGALKYLLPSSIREKLVYVKSLIEGYHQNDFILSLSPDGCRLEYALHKITFFPF